MVSTAFYVAVQINCNGNIWRERNGHGQSQDLNPDQDTETQRQGERRKEVRVTSVIQKGHLII